MNIKIIMLGCCIIVIWRDNVKHDNVTNYLIYTICDSHDFVVHTFASQGPFVMSACYLREHCCNVSGCTKCPIWFSETDISLFFGKEISLGWNQFIWSSISNYVRVLYHYCQVVSKNMGRLLQRNFQQSLFSSFLFSCISSQIFPSHLYNLLNLVYLYVLLLAFSLNFLYIEFSSAIRIKWPNHLNLLFECIFLCHPPISSNLILIFIILSFVLRNIALKYFITKAWILLSVYLLLSKVSIQYSNILLK